MATNRKVRYNNAVVVDAGALKMALNVLERAGGVKGEVAAELQATVATKEEFLALAAAEAPEEYMKHVSPEMMICHT